MAVGYGIDEAGMQQTQAEGGTAASGPSKNSRRPQMINPALLGVSCASAKACTAVGSYLDQLWASK